MNAKNHTKEAEIIADAGKKNSVIITTSISGRGVDIKLGGNPEQSGKENYNKDKEWWKKFDKLRGDGPLSAPRRHEYAAGSIRSENELTNTE